MSGNQLPGRKATGAARPSQSSPREYNNRSCILCNQRKVRCDKNYPCDRCIRAREKCIYPGPKRAPRKLKRPPIAEILAHVRDLEDELIRTRSAPSSVEHNVFPSPEESSEVVGKSPSELQNQHGRLISKEGKSRYVGDKVSVALGDKIRGFWELYDISSSSDDESASPTLIDSFGLRFVGNFRYHSRRPVGFSIKYLLPSQISTLWQNFQENVAPLMGIFHIPSVERLITRAIHDIDLDSSSEAVLLSVFFAAVVSMNSEQCLNVLDCDRETSIQEYKIALDQALLDNNFIRTQDMCLLQAAVLFLLCLLRSDDTRLVWAASAVVVRVAQGQGIHRDGQHLGLMPFETEMRRRLWWYICLLDMLCSEDQGTDTQIKPGLYDTRSPSNIDNSDLSPSLMELPPEKLGYTDITICIIQSEVMTKFYWLDKPSDTILPSSTQSREDILKSLANHLEDQYLKQFDLGVPVQWMTAIVARLTLSRAWLSIHCNPTAWNVTEAGLPLEASDEAFKMAVEVVKFSILLETNEATSQWAWLFKSYKQWHVVAFILSELGNRAITPETDIAWDLVTRIYRLWEQEGPERNIMLQKPLSRLMQSTARSRASKQGTNYIVAADDQQQELSSSAVVTAAETSIPSIPVGLGVDLTSQMMSGVTIAEFDSIMNDHSSNVDRPPLHDWDDGLEMLKHDTN